VNAGAAPVSLWTRLLEYAERRLPALTRLRRQEALPIVLNRHRIYVLPTRFGLLYSAILVVMLLGALNYNNNPALLLTCLLGAAAYQSVFQAFRTLNRLEVHALRAEACHAGDTLHIDVHFRSGPRPRRSLCLQVGDNVTNFDLALGSGSVRIDVPAPHRGWHRPGRMRLSSEYPFGLFQVWSWLNPECAALIYPRLEVNAPALPQAGAGDAARTVRMSGDELAALREYRTNDPLRNIAWKASARHDVLLVREFELRRGQEIVLDYARLRGLAHEARIARLARWVCQAETAQQPYALHLPDRVLGSALGPAHRHTCLRELALLPDIVL